MAIIYLVAASTSLPPLGLLLNGQVFSALLNLVLIVPYLIFGFVLWLVPSLHDRGLYGARGPQAP